MDAAYERYRRALEGLDPPFAFVDLDAFWANADDLVRRAAGTPGGADFSVDQPRQRGRNHTQEQGAPDPRIDYRSEIEPQPFTFAVLDGLGLRAKLAVLTNKPIASTRRILAGLDLARHFHEDAVIGGDGPFPRKPNPAGLRYLADAACVSLESALFVGDSVTDWRTARAASMTVCLARYGFGFDGFPIEELGPEDRTIGAPADILDL